MIVSHKYKFIFIKTEKTAGTSIEIALSKFCGPNDIITPIDPEDEIKRRELGFRGPQNYLISLNRYSRTDFLKAVYRRKRLAFYNHADAEFVRRYIGEAKWNTYFKFCFERNPWDKVISWYYWNHNTTPKPSLSDFIETPIANGIKGFQLYTIDSEIVVDKVFFFEQIDQAMEEICRHTGLPEIPSLPNAKSGRRKDKRSYRDILSERDKEKIQKVYAREIAYFNYKW